MGLSVKAAAGSGLDAQGDGLSTWLDLEGDGDLDLFWTTGQETWTYINRNSHFDAEAVGRIRDQARQISKADYGTRGWRYRHVSGRKNGTAYWSRMEAPSR